MSSVIPGANFVMSRVTVLVSQTCPNDFHFPTPPSFVSVIPVTVIHVEPSGTSPVGSFYKQLSLDFLALLISG